MTERYFEKFPTINYANTVAVNITERTKVLSSAFANPFNYYRYDVVNNERPDTLANRFYNDEYMSWILYLTNNVSDPYYEWYMDQQTFSNFITLKYGSLQLASSKIALYRNNWYQNIDPYSISYYNALTPSLQKYYEPVLPSDAYATSPMAYRRKREDWKITTNSIVNYGVANGSFNNDEIVMVNFDGAHTGQGQVCFANSSSVSLQHVSGYTTGITITGSSYLYGTESQTNTVFTAATTLVNNIVPAESSYWSPVYYYDYEQEQNEANKSIVVLNPQYTALMASQLRSLLK